MTPQEVIEARMLELWGERNVARLARESDVPRESISKILGYKRGIGDEVATKLASPLKLSPLSLVPPAAEAVTLASLDRRLQGLETDVREAVNLMREAIQLLREARGQADEGRQAQSSTGSQ